MLRFGETKIATTTTTTKKKKTKQKKIVILINVAKKINKYLGC